MSTSSPDGTRRSQGRVVAEFFEAAENYRFSEITQFVSVHPEARMDVTQHMLLIGSAGAGKSMAMRQLCSTLRDSDRLLPLYVHSERWIARPFAEAVCAPGMATSAATMHARQAATALLALGILHRVHNVLGAEAAFRATRVFPAERPQTPTELDDWIAHHVRAVSGAVRAGKQLPDNFRSLPDFREVLEGVADEVFSATQRRLLLLMDQLDRVSPLYFELLAPAFGRTTTYTLVVATRPSPCGPEATELPLPVGNCERAWIGTTWENAKWKRFLLDAAAHLFPPEVCSVLEARIDFLALLVGPSIRHFLKIAQELQRNLATGAIPRVALHEACSWLKSRFESDLEGALAGYEDAPRFLRSIQAAHGRSSDNPAQWPRRFAITPSDGQVFLGDEAVSRLRIAVREGLLVPAEPSRYGLDQVGLDFG